MKKINVIFFSIIVLIIFSCKQNQTRQVQPLLPLISGKPGEIIVVIDKYEWNSAIGDTLRKIFEAPYNILPQYEPIFDLIQLDHDGFGKIFMTHRNIIIINISETYSKSTLKV